MFVCAGLAEGKHKIEVANSETEIAQWIAEVVKVNLDPDRPMDDIKISVEKGGIIECVVRDNDTEHPLPRMRVSAYNETFRAISMTGENGKVRIRTFPGDYQVYASGRPYISWRLNDPAVVSKGQVTRVDVHLDKSPVIKGTVTEANGQPAGDVLVTIHPFGDHVYTDRNGRFVAGYDERRADKGLFVMARDLKRPLASAMRTKEFDRPLRLTMEPALTVKGKVTDPDGAGIPAARVSLHVVCADYSSGLAEVLTDSKGRFELNAIPPKHKALDYWISVHAAGFGPKYSISIEGRTGATAELPAIQLTPAYTSISGTVVDANGLPAARVPIFLNGSRGAAQPDKATATDEKGRFAINRICEAPVHLRANFSSSPGGSGTITANGGDTDVTIVLGQRSVHTPFISLAGKSLPELTSLKVELLPTDLTDKKILVCFFDMEQRPSRNCLRQLSAKAQELKAEGVMVAAVQASKIDENSLDEWAKRYNISFPLGMVRGDEEKARFTWGVRSLPWLILTDSRHVVAAAGFRLSELDAKIEQIDGD